MDPLRQEGEFSFYRLCSRPMGQEHLARSLLADLTQGEIVMIRMEDRLEPAAIIGRTAKPESSNAYDYAWEITRRANAEEKERYSQLPAREQAAATFCKERIWKLELPMHLVRAECYANGSKVIFYFTAENRVDFRDLVKDLVQEFRTRVEMRQIGVRHETQMTGGIGACGRELCCASFLHNFESVSIKMAKTQDLPLNPAKISGVCNRLLCCLTYEFASYRAIKREMPRPGQQLSHADKMYRVTRVFPMQGTVLAVSDEGGGEVTLTEEQWKEAEPAARAEEARKKGKEKDSAKSFPRKGKKG
ncbi:PSP1 domain-containing protein [Candidatus Electronema sp. PJ]|uniref:PSP1 domain-containing protein n=1 Tax=Candidatus Electronema sp. PJ TaxID=3401572 RepID=UPI003AA94DBA